MADHFDPKLEELKADRAIVRVNILAHVSANRMRLEAVQSKLLPYVA